MAASLATLTFTGLSASVNADYNVAAALKTFTLTANAATTAVAGVVEDVGEIARDNIFPLLDGASLEGQADGIAELSRDRVHDLLDGNIII